MLTILTPPEQDPLYVEDVKRYLRVTDDADDTLILDLIASVTAWLAGRDGWLGRSLINQTLELTVPLQVQQGFVGPHWAGAGCIVLPRPPHLSIQSISQLDRAGAAVLLSPSMYFASVGGGGFARVSFKPDVSWIGTTSDVVSIVVRYEAGYGSNPENVDAGIRQAMLMTIARLYANRGDGLTSDFREDRFVQSLFAPYRVWL
jgi:uncharacterized phiE125 gp8 family phage protein